MPNPRTAIADQIQDQIERLLDAVNPVDRGNILGSAMARAIAFCSPTLSDAFALTDDFSERMKGEISRNWKRLETARAKDRSAL